VTFIACAPKVKIKYPDRIIMPTLPKEQQDYAVFLKQNMEERDKEYSTDYTLFDFVVDTDYGSTLIQNLIDPKAVSSIIYKLGVQDLEHNDKLSTIYEYVVSEYVFEMDPYKWQTVEETVKAKKGDCKDLSLLLMSLLLSAGIDSHVSISNGHMWTNVFFDNEWHVLEVDKNSERNKIYHIPGFYENPLYKVFIDHAIKRRRLHVPLKGHQEDKKDSG
jgi:hypothetical protein